jgi:hypothetical protein
MSQEGKKKLESQKIYLLSIVGFMNGPINITVYMVPLDIGLGWDIIRFL